jgi:aryl-alcohol dehydrogenase-like predicted oxidoreductase
MYGPVTGEELVGRAVAPYRERVVLATKFGGVTLDETGKIVGGPNGRPDYLRRAVEGGRRPNCRQRRCQSSVTPSHLAR